MDNNTKYTTVEGHPVEVAKCYELRDGAQIFIVRLDPVSEYTKPILFAIVGFDTCKRARRLGDFTDNDKSSDWDIMRPWKAEKAQKVCEACLVEPGGVIPVDVNHNCLDCGKPIRPPQLEPALTMMEDLQSYPNTYDALDSTLRTALRIVSNYIEKHCEVKK